MAVGAPASEEKEIAALTPLYVVLYVGLESISSPQVGQSQKVEVNVNPQVCRTQSP